MEISAWIAFALLVVVAVFQLALALGVPAGAAAWGGSHPGVLPVHLRVASGVAGLVIYPAVAAVILGSARVIDGPDFGRVGMWILTGVFGLSVLGNLASRSKIERIWGPVALVVAVCCAVIALAS